MSLIQRPFTNLCKAQLQAQERRPHDGGPMETLNQRKAAMRTSRTHTLMRAALLGALLTGTALAAHARGGVSLDLSVGIPVGPAYYGGPIYAPAYGSYVNTLPGGSVSLSVSGGSYWRHGGVWYRPYGPRWVVVAPPVYYGPPPVIVQERPAVVVEEGPPPVKIPRSKPDPIVYPRNGQNAQQTEADRQDCNRWATTQPSAMADASVFYRAVEACMDGRGYTMK
jgi:hypothetical protein